MVWLLGVLAVLLAALFGIRMMNERQAEKEAEEEAAAVVYINQMEHITGISYDSGDGEMTFEKTEDGWSYVQDPDFPLSSEYPDQIAEYFGSLTAVRELEGADEPAAYGVDEPLYTISLTDSEKGEETLYFGEMTGDNYYVMAETTGNIYTVSSTAVTYLEHTLDEMAEDDE